MFNTCLSTLAGCVTHVPWPRERSRHVRASIFNENFFKLWNSAYCTSEDVFVKHLELLDERRHRAYYGHTNLYVNLCVTRAVPVTRVCSQRREGRWREPPPLLPFHHRQLREVSKSLCSDCVFQNRGVYMFRIDNDHVIDATLTGGPARWVSGVTRHIPGCPRAWLGGTRARAFLSGFYSLSWSIWSLDRSSEIMSPFSLAWLTFDYVSWQL